VVNRSKVSPALLHLVEAELRLDPRIGGRRLAKKAQRVLGLTISHTLALQVKKRILNRQDSAKTGNAESLRNRKVYGDSDPELLEASPLVRDPQFEIGAYEPVNSLDFEKGHGTAIPDRDLYKIVPGLMEPPTWKARMIRKQELKQIMQTVPPGLRRLLNAGSNTLRRLGFSPKRDPELGTVLGNMLRSTCREIHGRASMSSQQVVNLALRVILMRRFGPERAERYLSKLTRARNELTVGIGSRGELIIE